MTKNKTNEMKQMYVVKIKYNEINNYIIYVLYKQLAVLKVAGYYAEIWYCKIYLWLFTTLLTCFTFVTA